MAGEERTFQIQLEGLIQLLAQNLYDRGELDLARDLLTELDEHAAALDRDTGTTTLAAEAVRSRQRLVELDDAP